MFFKLYPTIENILFQDKLIKRADVCDSFILLQALCINNYTSIICRIFLTDRIQELKLKYEKLRKIMHSARGNHE